MFVAWLRVRGHVGVDKFRCVTKNMKLSRFLIVRQARSEKWDEECAL